MQPDNLIVKDNGVNNTLALSDIPPQYKGKLIIEFNGDSNRVVFGEECYGKSLEIHVNGSNNKVLIGRKSSINGYVFLKNSNNKVSIGKFTTVVQFKVECEWGTDVDIGEDCMFSRDITIRTGDSHSIIDLNTNKRVNFPKSVFIGKHVWVGYGANIAKGSEIQQNSVIGAASYVNKVFKCGNVVIAGVPAKITKENITWDRRSLSDEIPERHIQNLKDRYLFVEQKS